MSRLIADTVPKKKIKQKDKKNFHYFQKTRACMYNTQESTDKLIKAIYKRQLHSYLSIYIYKEIIKLSE